MRRRDFIGLLGGTATFIPLIAWAQQPALIGVLNAASAKSNASSYEAFRAALRKLGYVEGRNIRFEYRYADGFLDRLPTLAEELVRLELRESSCRGPPAREPGSAQGHRYDPDRDGDRRGPGCFGLVQSLHRPGGNVTGLANFAEELASKQIDVIQELLPRLARVAALINVENPLHVPQLRETQAAAAKASLALVHFEFRVPADLEQAFDEFVRARPRPFWCRRTRPSPPIGRALQLAAKARLPAIYGDRRAVESGGLLSYGPNVMENYRRSAAYVDKILKGANPADLPVVQPIEVRVGDQPQDRQSARAERFRPALLDRRR